MKSNILYSEIVGIITTFGRGSNYYIYTFCLDAFSFNEISIQDRENILQVQESLKSLIGLEKNILQMKGLQKKK